MRHSGLVVVSMIRRSLAIALIVALYGGDAWAGLYADSTRDSSGTDSSATLFVSSQASQVTLATLGAQSAPPVYTPGMFPSLGKIFLALIVVIGAIYLCVWLLRRAMGRHVSSGRRQDVIETLETTFIGPKKSLAVVRVGKRAAVVAITETSVSMLLELSSVEAQEIIAAKREPVKENGFVSVFALARKRLGARETNLSHAEGGR